jgi:hypothetical protein
MLYDMKSRPEYEANLFASEILLPDDAIFSYAHEGYDIEQIARILYTDINLIALKMASMNSRGYQFRTVYDPKSDFLKKKQSIFFIEKLCFILLYILETIVLLQLFDILCNIYDFFRYSFGFIDCFY